ncbi:MAG TPA: Hpt domain-containing protein [Fimbriimonadaceae bacterium]|nr:Hpt domain-containing protein [Fimbriimonadaceae bacterium]HRJ95623.1 Hpt domain-containing protein [Fimbriimonadaceae bacterium]
MSIFDESKLREISGGDRSFIVLVLDEFTRSGHECLERLREAAEHGDSEGAHQLLHTLKGSARTVGAEEMGELAGRWETRVQQEGLGSIATCLQELEQAWHRLMIHLDEQREAA